MRESAFQTQLLTSLRLNRRWEVLKHADQYTSGIPDVSVTLCNSHCTVWLELKTFQKPSQCLNEPRTFVDNQVQLLTCCRLSTFYVVHDPFRSHTMAIPARLLARHMDGLKGLQLPQPGFLVSGNGHREVYSLLNGVMR